jgi:hypothetical protein
MQVDDDSNIESRRVFNNESYMNNDESFNLENNSAVSQDSNRGGFNRVVVLDKHLL